MINPNDKIPGTQNFIWKEAFTSVTADRLGIRNYPNSADEDRILNNVMYMMQDVQKARTFLGVPLRVNSCYRCPALNKAVGGSATSFHAHGMAADISFPAGTKASLEDLFTYFHATGRYTELIAEDISPMGGWIHFALAQGRENERQLKYKLVGKPVVRASFVTVMEEVFNKYMG